MNEFEKDFYNNEEYEISSADEYLHPEKVEEDATVCHPSHIWNNDDFQNGTSSCTALSNIRAAKKKPKTALPKRLIAAAVAVAVLNLAVLGGIFAVGYNMGRGRLAKGDKNVAIQNLYGNDQYLDSKINQLGSKVNKVGAGAAALAALNAQLQAKEAENAQLKSQLAAAKAALAKCQNAPKDVEMFDAAQSVFFSINSSKIDSKKEILNLKALAEAAKEAGVKLTVTGYADSATGSAAYNQTLSEARAKAVAAKLVEMGVPESQLIVEGKGGVDAEKPIQLNRRVIIAPAK